jgi:hypothetical protein
MANPQTTNFLSPLNFKLVLKRAPNIDFFIQKARIPGVKLPAAPSPTPIVNIPYPGDHLEYSDFDVTFKIDEELANYNEVYSWMTSLGRLFPGAYLNLQQQQTFTGASIKSDIALVVLDSHRNPTREIVFHEAWPTAMSDIEFNTTLEDVTYITATATFKYVYYDINKVI